MTAALFIKEAGAVRAAAERAGWRAVAHLLPVPRLRAVVTAGERAQLHFDDVFANGRCQHLLADAIALADHGFADTAPVIELIQGVSADLIRAVARTGKITAVGRCVPALYHSRLCRDGRIDQWYQPHTTFAVGGYRLGLAEFAGYTIDIDGVGYSLDLPALIERTRSQLRPSGLRPSAITQGDPTEPNIAYPRTWLDFEYAGRNAIAGDIANLTWYLLAMGGWLVPTYQPDTWRRTVRHPLPPIIQPTVENLTVDVRERHIHLRPRWHVGAGRAAALRALRTELRTSLGQLCLHADIDLTEALIPWLVTRILGVIPLSSMTGADAALCLALLAQLQHGAITIDQLLTRPIAEEVRIP